MMLSVILCIFGGSLVVNSLVLNPHELRRRNNVFPDKTQIIWKTSNDKDTNDDEFIINTSREQPPEIPLGAKDDDDSFIVPIVKTENSKYKNPNNFRYSSENLQNIARKTLKYNYIAKDDTFDDEAQFIQTSTTEPSKSQGKKSFQDIADDNAFFIKPSTTKPSVYFQHKPSLSRNSLSQDSALPEHPLKSNSVIDGNMNKKSITLELTDAVSSTAQKDDDDDTEDDDHNNDDDTDSNNDDNNESGDNDDSNDDDDNDDNNNKDDFDNNGDDANNKNNNNEKDDENDDSNNDSDDDNADNDDDDASDPLSDLTKHKNWKLVNNGGDCGRNRRYTVKTIGGENADLGEYPWMARLVYTSKKEDSEKGECGGTLINKRYVLTSARCCKDNKHGDLTYVRLGEYDIHTARDCFEGICAPSSVEVTVSSTTTHPLFPPEHDICLIRLTDDVQFTNYIQPICLPSKIQTDKKELDGKNMTVAGWGATELLPDVKLARLPDVLQELEVTVWSMEKCDQMLGGGIDWRKLICAGGAVPAHSPCPGDSGGPLMYLDPTLDSGRQVLMGIVSNGLVCSNTIPIPSPAFYTRVSTVMPWILDTITK